MANITVEVTVEVHQVNPLERLAIQFKVFKEFGLVEGTLQRRGKVVEDDFELQCTSPSQRLVQICLYQFISTCLVVTTLLDVRARIFSRVTSTIEAGRFGGDKREMRDLTNSSNLIPIAKLSITISTIFYRISCNQQRSNKTQHGYREHNRDGFREHVRIVMWSSLP